jgi:DNA-binding NarL/FixJ family response regulator
MSPPERLRHGTFRPGAELIRDGSSCPRLTPFERRLLGCLANGMDRTEIAELVHLSPQTVSHMLTVAKEKLGARSLVQAAVLIAREEAV